MEDHDFPPQDSILDDSYKPLHQLIDESPKWDPNFAPELATLCRNHIVVRSALGFALELARGPELALRNASTMDEVRVCQGQIKGLENYVGLLIAQMTAAETPEEKEEDNVDPQAEI